MIIRSGAPFSTLIDFSSGHPDANIAWTLLGPDGSIIASGSMTPPASALSMPLVITGSNNTLNVGEIASYRDVTWLYTVNGLAIYEERRYLLEARLPMGISTDGVRTKLGADAVDLPDSDISLVQAYIAFQDVVGEDVLDDAVSDGYNSRVRDAIEALAAIALISTMPVRIASKESSGTSQFQRQKIDWELVKAQLEELVLIGILDLVPNYTPIGGFGDLFLLATPATDPVTGSAYS